MKNKIEYAGIIIMVIAAFARLNPKASAWEIVLSFSIVIIIAAVFAYRMDRDDNRKNKK